MVIVSRHHSRILKTEEEFSLHILSVLSEIRDSSLMPSSQNCFRCENSFQPSGVIQESFQLVPPKAIISEGLFILSIQLSFSNLDGTSVK